ncbi:hypothetical protein CDAR_289061 [Caerostris darwini]|uniref:Uncharacterized protein n=1 Tax=Caerostris darwini TaxID=1538125 RepID=A0AAV4PEF8_9ARAC|nr:hypothetical protein CDAR_289061 [Caerostris darwini]
MNGRIGMRPPNSFVWEFSGKKKSRETAKGWKIGREVSEMYCSSVIDGCWVWVLGVPLTRSICLGYRSQSVRRCSNLEFPLSYLAYLTQHLVISRQGK